MEEVARAMWRGKPHVFYKKTLVGPAILAKLNSP